MRIGFSTIKVKDLVESVNFYTDILDLEEVKNFSPQDGVNITFLQDKEKNMIELIEDEKNTDLFNKNDSLVSIGVEVENLDNTIEMLKEKSIKIFKGPIQVPSGERFVFIKDPNGVEIEFIEGFNIQ